MSPKPADLIKVQTEDFDVAEIVEALHRSNPGVGAVASFVGIVRDLNEDTEVGALTLEHYPGMTERALGSIALQAHERWDIEALAIVHRVGRLTPTDRIVLVAVASAHRHHAFDACRFIMDYLKTEAPFWKKESTPDGERWVPSRESDAVAAARWNADSTQSADEQG